MFDAYNYRPYPDAVAFLQGPEHHTVACRAARKKGKTATERNTVCFCDLPAHVRQMQDEAMGRAAKVLIDWFEKRMQAVVAPYGADAPNPGGDPIPVRVPAVEAGALKSIVADARKRFES